MPQPIIEQSAFDGQEPSVSGAKLDPKVIFDIENIVGHFVTSNGDIYYKVKWEGYESSENSWVTLDDFVDATIVEEYLTSGTARKLKTGPFEDESDDENYKPKRRRRT